MSLHESSIFVGGYDAPAKPLPQREWDVLDSVPPKSSIMDYGYIVNGQTVGCTRDELVESLLKRRRVISFVWTPDTPQPVRPEQVPFLVGALREIETKSARQWILWGAAIVALAVIIAFVSQSWGQFSRDIIFTLGALILAAGNTRYWRSRTYTQEDAVNDASAGRFDDWVQKKTINGYAIAVLGSIGLVSIIASIAVDSNALAGLVKPAVWRGEWWRLFTAPLLQSELAHFVITAAGLVLLSKRIEQTIHRAFVPLLFLVSAVAGSVSSLLFDPLTTPLGSAAGGLMGLVGFIATASFLDRTNYPVRYFQRMIMLMAVFFGVTIFGFEVFDPAAGAGGIVAGGILGWLSVKLNRPSISEKLLKVAGVGGVLGVAASAAFAISRLLS